MLSDNTFRGIGHFQEDTSSIGIPFLRLSVKALLKSVLRLLYTMAIPLLYNAHRKCPSRLPVLVLPNGCSINVLLKNATWNSRRTMRQYRLCTMPQNY